MTTRRGPTGPLPKRTPYHWEEKFNLSAARQMEGAMLARDVGKLRMLLEKKKFNPNCGLKKHSPQGGWSGPRFSEREPPHVPHDDNRRSWTIGQPHSLLDTAVYLENWDMIRLLIQHGARPSSRTFHIAIKYHHPFIEKMCNTTACRDKCKDYYQPTIPPPCSHHLRRICHQCVQSSEQCPCRELVCRDAFRSFSNNRITCEILIGGVGPYSQTLCSKKAGPRLKKRLLHACISVNDPVILMTLLSKLTTVTFDYRYYRMLADHAAVDLLYAYYAHSTHVALNARLRDYEKWDLRYHHVTRRTFRREVFTCLMAWNRRCKCGNEHDPNTCQKTNFAVLPIEVLYLIFEWLFRFDHAKRYYSPCV